MYNHLDAENWKWSTYCRQSIKDIFKGIFRKQIKEKLDLGLCEHREPVVHAEDCLVPAPFPDRYFPTAPPPVPPEDH